MYIGSSDQRGRPRSISATPRCPYRRRKSSRLVCSFGGREPPRYSSARRSCAVRVLPRLSGDRPERQVHLCRAVVRERAHRHAPFVVGGEVTEELAGERVGGEAGDEYRRHVGQNLRRAVTQQSLGGGETF